MTITTQLTQNPKTKPPVDKLGFGRHFTDHMFVVDYTEDKGWHDPAIVPYAPLAMDPASMVFHYGQAVFEGLKAYKTEDGRILLFRAEKNFARMNVSNERMCMPTLDVDFALEALKALIKVDQDWIPTADGTSLYIRPFIMATEAHLGVKAADSYKFVIILSPVGSYYPQGINPVDICIEEELVRAVRGGIGFTKAAANYAISLRGQVKAHEKGYTQVLWLDGIERKYIEEVGTTNVFFKINGELVTPMLTGSILPGVTRDSVITLAKDWGIPMVERRISVDELFECYEKGTLEEAFASGTAAVISPIGTLNWNGKKITLSGGGIGELSQKFYDAITGIQYGKIQDPFQWVIEVN